MKTKKFEKKKFRCMCLCIVYEYEVSYRYKFFFSLYRFYLNKLWFLIRYLINSLCLEDWKCVSLHSTRNYRVDKRAWAFGYWFFFFFSKYKIWMNSNFERKKYVLRKNESNPKKFDKLKENKKQKHVCVFHTIQF